MTTPTEICEQITALIVLNAAGALAPHSLGVSTRVLLNRSRALIAAQAVEIERLTARALAAEAALEKMRSDPSMARFARLLGICHKIKWTDHRTPATGNDETDAALEDLAEFLFLDAVADLTTQGGGE